MNLKDLEIRRLKYWVFDGMDTVTPRGDRVEETEELLRALNQACPGQTVLTDAKRYLEVIFPFEQALDSSISVGEEAVRRIQAANIRVSDEEAVGLFGKMTTALGGRFRPCPGLIETVRLIQSLRCRALLYSTTSNLGRIGLLKSGIPLEFDRCYFSGDLRADKRGPNGFRLLLRREMQALPPAGRVSLHSEQFVLVDDVQAHCAQAESVGWKSVLVAAAGVEISDVAQSEEEQQPWIRSVSDLLDPLRHEATTVPSTA